MSADREGARRDTLLALAVAAIAGIAYAPSLRNGFLFLGFDDAILFEADALQGLSWGNLWALLTRPHFAHYTPVTFLWFAADRWLWAGNPVPYHLENILVHALAAALAFLWVRRALGSTIAAFVAAVCFAAHPAQAEAVSLVIQRKTLLSAVFLFAALLAYDRWRCSGGRPAWAAALVLAVLACLSKPTAAVFPALLLLEEWALRRGPLRLADKLPFFAVSAATAAAAMWGHRAVGVQAGWHGGSLWNHARIMARVRMEELLELVVPATAAPAHYYRDAQVHDPLNLAALGACALVIAWAVVRVRAYPRAAFAVGWYILTLLPSANVVPLVQLRASRFLYLPVLGFGMGLGLALEAIGPRLRPALRKASIAALIGALVAATWMALPTWRNDVSAWARAVQVHPWAPSAHMMFGRALLESGAPARAARELQRAVALDPSDADSWYFLARAWIAQGMQRHAAFAARRFAALAPDDPRTRQFRLTPAR